MRSMARTISAWVCQSMSNPTDRFSHLHILREKWFFRGALSVEKPQAVRLTARGLSLDIATQFLIRQMRCARN